MIAIQALKYRNLHIPDLVIPEGTTTIIGPNGSGKTSLLSLIAGIALPEFGTITIDGSPPRECVAGWVDEYPDRSLIFSIVADEIASSLRFQWTHCAETEARVRAIATCLGIAPLLDRDLQDLSGGERTLVALAAALVGEPYLLVLDEFDAHLDQEICRTIDQILAVSGARYILRCTQRMDIAASAANLIYLEHGMVTHSGTPASVFPNLKHSVFYPLAWRRCS
jgi:energy-coupling factor transport system ATP-binding protein